MYFHTVVWAAELVLGKHIYAKKFKVIQKYLFSGSGISHWKSTYYSGSSLYI